MIIKINSTTGTMLINTDYVISVEEYDITLGGTPERGIKINLVGETKKFVKGITLDQFHAELHQEDPALMCSALLKKLDEIAGAIHGGCGNIARSVR